MAKAAPIHSLSELIVGQQDLRSQLAENLRAGRVAHSYLFCGPTGAGKAAVALEFATLLLCEGGGLSPCGTCSQCAGTRRLQHPDLHLILPLPPAPRADMSYEDETGHFAERIAKTVETLAGDPYASLTSSTPRRAKGESDKRERTQKHSIRISWIRGLVQAAARKPFQAARRVFVILDADAMNANAQNALLKCLEEPFENSFFLLVTGKERDLLPTIRSRCQTIRLQPIVAEEIIKALVSSGVDEGIARAAATLSAGDYAYARILARSDLASIEERVVSFLRAAAMCNPLELPKECESVGSSGGVDESAFLGLLARFLREISLIRIADSSEQPPLLAFHKSESVIRNLIKSYPSADLETMAQSVDQASVWLEQGYSRDYVLYALAIRLNASLGPRITSKTTVRHARSA